MWLDSSRYRDVGRSGMNPQSLSYFALGFCVREGANFEIDFSFFRASVVPTVIMCLISRDHLCCCLRVVCLNESPDILLFTFGVNF